MQYIAETNGIGVCVKQYCAAIMMGLQAEMGKMYHRDSEAGIEKWSNSVSIDTRMQQTW